MSNDLWLPGPTTIERDRHLNLIGYQTLIEHHKEHHETEGELRIIIAALLEACEAIVNVPAADTKGVQEAWEQIRAAIAQAKGLVAHEEVSCDNP